MKTEISDQHNAQTLSETHFDSDRAEGERDLITFVAGFFTEDFTVFDDKDVDFFTAL